MDANKDKYATASVGAIDVNKKEYDSGSSSATSSFGDVVGDGSGGAAGTDENKYAGKSFGTTGSFGSGVGSSATGIDKDKDIDSNFGSTATDRISGSVEKQLKISKFKILVTIINRKKSHLLKKTAIIKLT